MALEEMASGGDAWRRVGRLPELRKSDGRGNHAT